jgi:hypothetical protein
MKEVDKYIERHNHMVTDRGNWEAHWLEIAEVMYPFNDQFGQESMSGETKMNHIFDSVGVHANQLLSSGLFSMLTSPAQQWFSYVMTDDRLNEVHDVRLWTDVITDIAFHEINKPEASFNTAVHECYLEFGAFGNLALYVGEAKDRQSLLFQSLPLSQCYFLENDEGFVDTVYRKYTRSVRQLVQRFGKAVHPKVQELFDAGKYEQKIRCIHAIEPTEVFKPFTYESSYIDIDNKYLIQRKGFYEQPITAARFFKAAHEVYGRGPGSIALPDIKMLQEIMRTTLRAAQKVTDPPLMVPHDGFLMPIRTTPGGLNYYRSDLPKDNRILPMNFGSQPALGFDIMEDLRNRIRQIFYVDQLQLQEGPQMTATEVLQRTEEKLRLLGPLMGRLQSEFLGPLLNRVFNVLYRAGKFPPPPQQIEGQAMRVVYTSPIARAQEQTEANGILRSTQLLSPFVSADPSLMDNINGDELVPGVFNMFSVSAKYLNSKAVVKKIRADRQKMQQAQQVANIIKEGGAGIKSLTEARANAGAEGINIPGVA